MTDGTYVITVRGVAGPWVRAAFDDVALSAAGDRTVLRDGTDQAALHGLLGESRTSGSNYSIFTWNRRSRREAPGDESAAGQDAGALHGGCIRGSEAT